MKIIRKQNNSRNCIICGVDNALGVKAPFYELEDGRLATEFVYRSEHQSYPGRVHGGMITCMLDELAGRVIWITEPAVYAVTTSINVKFRKPVPYGERLYGLGELISNHKRGYTAHAKICNLRGDVLAEAEVTYLKLLTSAITDQDMDEEMGVYLEDEKEEWTLE